MTRRNQRWLVVGFSMMVCGCGGGAVGAVETDTGADREIDSDSESQDTDTSSAEGPTGSPEGSDSFTSDTVMGSTAGGSDELSDTGLSTDEPLVLDVVSGFGHTCALTADKEIYCFGANQGGQIGNGKKTPVKNVTTPERILEPGPWKKVTAGTYHTCGIKEDNSLWCWGGNGQGQLGLGDLVDHPKPTQVGTDQWTDISGHNFEHTCGIKFDGSLWCWGDNTMGQLGNGGSGSSADEKAPSLVDEGPFHQVSTGGAHTCAVDTAGALWCFGANHNGRLGRGAPDPSQAPPLEPLPQKVGEGYAQVQAGGGMTCAIDTEGSLACFGMNNLGQVGVGSDGVNVDQVTPQTIGDAKWRASSGGGSHACGVQESGGLYCWGSSEYGQLGQGTSGKGTYEPAPMQVGGDRFKVVSTGGDHTCAVRDDGALFCFGLNYKGQLGQGFANATPVTEPVRVFLH